jgi:hypothetical protein
MLSVMTSVHELDGVHSSYYAGHDMYVVVEVVVAPGCCSMIGWKMSSLVHSAAEVRLMPHV